MTFRARPSRAFFIGRKRYSGALWKDRDLRLNAKPYGVTRSYRRPGTMPQKCNKICKFLHFHNKIIYLLRIAIFGCVADRRGLQKVAGGLTAKFFLAKGPFFSRKENLWSLNYLGLHRGCDAHFEPICKPIDSLKFV
jgi:hypothetical protein